VRERQASESVGKETEDVNRLQCHGQRVVRAHLLDGFSREDAKEVLHSSDIRDGNRVCGDADQVRGEISASHSAVLGDVKNFLGRGVGGGRGDCDAVQLPHTFCHILRVHKELEKRVPQSAVWDRHRLDDEVGVECNGSLDLVERDVVRTKGCAPSSVEEDAVRDGLEVARFGERVKNSRV
jgi:hypothetical protein